MIQPPCGLSDRQPSRVSVVPSAVTNIGWPSTIAKPFKWQRSSAASAVINGGRQRERCQAGGFALGQRPRRPLLCDSWAAEARLERRGKVDPPRRAERKNLEGD